MILAELFGSTKDLNITTLITSLKTLNTEKVKGAIVNKILSATNYEVEDSTLQEAGSHVACGGALASETVSTEINNVEKEKSISINQALSKSYSTLAASLGLTTFGLSAIIGVAAAFVGLTVLVDKFEESIKNINQRIKENTDTLAEYTSKTEQLKSKLEELNSTDLTDMSYEYQESMKAEIALVEKEIELYESLSKAKQDAIALDTQNLVDGIKKENGYIKGIQQILKGNITGALDTYMQSVFRPETLLTAFGVPTGLVFPIGEDSLLTQADDALDEYKKLEEEYSNYAEKIINADGTISENAQEKLEKYEAELLESKVKVGDIIEQLQVARDELSESNPELYADDIFAIDERINYYLNDDKLEKIDLSNVVIDTDKIESDVEKSIIELNHEINTIMQEYNAEDTTDERKFELFKQYNDLIDERILKIDELNQRMEEFGDNSINEEDSLYKFIMMMIEINDELSLLNKPSESIQNIINDFYKLIGAVEKFKDSIEILGLQETLVDVSDYLMIQSDQFTLIQSELDKFLDNIKTSLNDFKDWCSDWWSIFGLSSIIKTEFDDISSIVNKYFPNNTYQDIDKEDNKPIVEDVEVNPVISDDNDLETYLSNNKELRDSLIQLADLGKLDEDSMSSLDGYSDLLETTGLEVDELIEKIKELSEEVITPFDNVNDLSNVKKGLDSLANAYQEKFGEDADKIISPDVLSGLYEDFGDVEGFDEFIVMMQDVNATAEDTQRAFDKIASSYLKANYNLSNLTDSNKEYTITALKKVGIENAEELVESNLARMNGIRSNALKEVLAVQKHSTVTMEQMNSMSKEELSNLINETEAAGGTANALRQLLIAKMNLTKSQINEAKSIESLIQLAGTAAVSAEQLNILNLCKQGYIKDSTVPDSILKIAKENLQKALDAQFIDYNNSFGSYKPEDSSSGSSDSGTDTYKEAFEKELKDLQYLRDMGVIDEKAYLDKLNSLNKKFFEGKAKYLDEYRQYQKEYYDGMLQVMDTVISAVEDKINDKIDQLNEQKENIENYYQTQIDAIQETIDALQDENDEIDRNMALQKAKYQLQKMLNQRTSFIYDGEQFVYRANMNEVQEAQEELRDAELDKTVGDLESSIKALEKAMETETKDIDNQIKELEDYRDQWKKVVDDYQKGINAQIAAQILGANWEKDILNKRLDTLNNFKNQYIAIQEAMRSAVLDNAVDTSSNIGSGSVSTSNGGGNNSSNNSNNKDTKTVKRVVYTYNGVSYSTLEEAKKAKQTELNSAKEEYAKKSSTVGGGMPDSVRNKILSTYADKVKEIELRQISVQSFNKGGVITDDDNILSSIAHSVGEDTLVAAKKGERILTPLQNDYWDKLTESLPTFTKMLDIFENIRKPSQSIQPNKYMNTSVVQNINITLPNITDSSRANDLLKELDTTILQRGIQYFNQKK